MLLVTIRCVSCQWTLELKLKVFLLLFARTINAHGKQQQTATPCFLTFLKLNQNNEVTACFCFQQNFIFPSPVHKNQRVDILFVFLGTLSF